MLVEIHDPRVPGMWSSHPDIAPHVGGPLDFTAATHAVYLTGEHGCFAFEPQEAGVFEGHVMLARAGRGRWGFAALHNALRHMAGRGAERVWCRVPRPEVGFFARKGGFSPAVPLPDGTPVMEWRSSVCPPSQLPA